MSLDFVTHTASARDAQHHLLPCVGSPAVANAFHIKRTMLVVLVPVHSHALAHAHRQGAITHSHTQGGLCRWTGAPVQEAQVRESFKRHSQDVWSGKLDDNQVRSMAMSVAPLCLVYCAVKLHRRAVVMRRGLEAELYTAESGRIPGAPLAMTPGLRQ